MFYIASRAVTAVSAFLYPGYSSYKTLSQRPASEEDLERWLMYWSVLGCIVSVEYVAEWLISWIPLYYPLKTLFLLYLALPQTKGASYIYVYHLQPFFHSHESEIDATLASFKVRIYTFVQDRLRALWAQVAASIGQPTQQPVESAGAPPSLGDPVSGPVQLVSGLWRSYGPSIIAGGAALLQQSRTAAAANATNTRQALNSPPLPPQRQGSETESVLERRRRLEAELAALASPQGAVPPLPIPPASASYNAAPSRTSSSSDLRDRSHSFGGAYAYEEVEVPSDAEGELSEPERPALAGRNSGWFSGWGGPGKGDYEKVKSE
ncbi:hypothetical protein PLICRDRAFT_696766 [Plicaturopsis crispa FD-325 SS-3]|nr:hypothetical protein PLICRDRAFT_696766 [Plicaturopsis crispa FD-325 SS-3]